MCFLKKIKKGQLWIKKNIPEMYKESEMDEVLDIYGKWVKYKSGETGLVWVESKKDFCMFRIFYRDTP